MGRLRDRMIDDMKLRGLAASTQTAYLRFAKQLSEFCGRSPATIGDEDIRAFLLDTLRERHLAPPTRIVCVAALRFLFGVTLRRPDAAARIPFPQPAPFKLPNILSGTEVQRLLAALTSPRHHALCSLIYATGLRLSEACTLVPEDIDSVRGILRVRQGKGSKDRIVPLGNKLLAVLRHYWRTARPQSPFLFPGQPPSRPITRVAVHEALRKAAQSVGLSKPVSAHVLRHCFATHMLEMGADLRVIQVILGHRRLASTLRYVHVAREHIATVRSPLDVLGTPAGRILR